MSKDEDRIIAQHQKAFGYILSQAHGLFHARLTEAIAGEPVHMGHVVLLASLFAQNDLTQAQLSQISGIEKSSIVLFLDALEKDGWLERRRHPTDRRAHLVHLTEDGRARFTLIGFKLKVAQEEALSVFSDAERVAFESYLLRLVGHMGG